MRRIMTCGAMVLALLTTAPVGHALDTKIVLATIGFPADTEEKVLAGEFVETALKTSSERDLNVGLAFLVKASPEVVNKKLAEEQLLLRVDPDTLAHATLEGDGSMAQFATLKLTPRQLAAYGAAKPGDALNLSTEEIAALKAAGTDSTALQDTVHELLLARYRAYRSGGLAGMAPYARKGAQTDPAADLRRVTALVRNSKLLPAEFYTLLDSYPKGAPPDLDQTFYWSQFEAHGADTIALVHVFRGTWAGDRTVVQRQFYVSTGYNTEQAIAGFLPVAQGTLVIYTNHTSTDQVAGFGGGAKRSIGRKLMASELKKLFEKTRDAAAN